jgi:hypothetical protein
MSRIEAKGKFPIRWRCLLLEIAIRESLGD